MRMMLLVISTVYKLRREFCRLGQEVAFPRECKIAVCGPSEHQ